MEEIMNYAKIGPRVISVKPNDDFTLILTFNNGEQRLFDVKPLLSLNVFKPLQNKEVFKSVKVAYGTILWQEEIDYCPDTLYAESVLVSSTLTHDTVSAVAEPDISYKTNKT